MENWLHVDTLLETLPVRTKETLCSVVDDLYHTRYDHL